MSASHENAGGFLPTLPSPPPSTAASSTTASPTLPAPRATPLKAGSAKESSFISYVDTKLLGISRRYEKRFNAQLENLADAATDVEGKGYEHFGEMARQLEELIDVVWVSGTPSLQTPYLLTLALTTSTSLPSFPFAPRSTFQLLHKLDLAFCSLLRGVNAESGEVLTGFQEGRGRLSTTEKVRMRGLVERTRVAVVEVAAKGTSTDARSGRSQRGGAGMRTETDYEEDFNFAVTTDDNDDNDDAMDMRIDGNHGRWEMEVARVYENTIVELGMALDIGVLGRGEFM